MKSTGVISVDHLGKKQLAMLAIHLDRRAKELREHGISREEIRQDGRLQQSLERIERGCHR